MGLPSKHNVDSRHLRYFLAVADTLSFRRAAEQLHIAQPALTRQIKALEEGMRVRLFERDSHHVALTTAGVVVREHARSILSAIDNAVESARVAATGEFGSLRIGFASHAAYEYLPLITRSFRNQFPGVAVRLQRYSAVQQFDLLHSETFDVAILRPLYADPLISSRVLVRSPFVAALPEGHRLLEGDALRLTDLADETFITLPSRKGPNYQAQILGFCLDSGFRPHSVLEVEDVQAIVGMVASGFGVAIVPASVSNLHIRGVQYRTLLDLDSSADYVVAWRRKAANPFIVRFVDIAEATMKEVYQQRLSSETGSYSSEHGHQKSET